METNLLDRMLSAYLTDRTSVTVTLQNKIRVSGKVKAFDSYVVVIDGQKQEILYRHAISSLTPFVQEEQKRPPAVSRPSTIKPVARPQKNVSQKPRPAHPAAAVSASPTESGINNSMKDALLKWMQEQNASK
jgi:RNA chaperone Hfq